MLGFYTLNLKTHYDHLFEAFPMFCYITIMPFLAKIKVVGGFFAVELPRSLTKSYPFT